MKPEQKMGIIFSAFGLTMGLLSNFIYGFFAILAFVVPIVGYVAMVFGMGRLEKSKKIKWVVVNSLLVFLMMWIIVWIFVFNIG